MGIEQWQCRYPGKPAAAPDRLDPVTPLTPERAPAPADQPAEEAAVRSVSAEAGWAELEAAVPACTACELHRSRRNTVFGVGSRHADWMVIGEAPGADEDRLGMPFVGRAGKLLDKILVAIGLRREQVFITNILKCRPPGNRDPKPEEAASCRAFLDHQIALVRPKIILAVGRVSAQCLLKRDVPVGRLRGTVHRFGPDGVPLVVTYHPAYLLRRPEEKRKVWDDLKLARAALVREASASGSGSV